MKCNKISLMVSLIKRVIRISRWKKFVLFVVNKNFVELKIKFMSFFDLKNDLVLLKKII